MFVCKGKFVNELENLMVFNINYRKPEIYWQVVGTIYHQTIQTMLKDSRASLWLLIGLHRNVRGAYSSVYNRGFVTGLFFARTRVIKSGPITSDNIVESLDFSMLSFFVS